MASLVYAPEVTIHIATAKTSRGKGSIIDVSEDISNGSVTRILNGLSSAEVTLLNQSRKYDGMFSPMDRIVVRLKRITTVLKFSGYLDAVPAYAAEPGSINLRASCTLKRLQNYMWDPGSSAAMLLMSSIDPNANRMEDGGLSELAIRVLTEVPKWPKNQIHIARIPHDWYDTVSKVADSLIAEAEALSMSNAIGQGAWVNGSNPVTGGSSTVTGIGPGTGQMPASTGKCSSFGGPGGGAYGNFALTGESGVHPKDQWYCAMRWPYVNPDLSSKAGVDTGRAKAWWANRKILVSNPKTGKAVVVRAADWGPNINTGRVIDLAPGAIRALGAATDDTLNMAFAPEGASLGPVTKANAGGGAALVGGGLLPSSSGGASAAPSTGWGAAGDASNQVQAHAAGCSWTCHRLAKTNFEGFVNDLVNTLGYHPKSIGGFNNRNIAGTSTKSNHAWGAAIDIDPSRNPRYGSGAGGPYALPHPPAIISLARKWGLYWGGEYHNSKDYMHFEVIGAPSTPKVSGYSGSNTPVAVQKWTPPIHTPPGYTITTRFGEGGSLWSSGKHSGTDFAVRAGTNIYPVGPGYVHQSGTGDASYGNWISIDMGNNIYTQYAHMNAPTTLSIGDHVDQSTVIGHVGQTGNATGPHVHVELRKGADTYTAATKSGGIEKYVLGGAGRSNPPAGTYAATGDYGSADAAAGIASAADTIDVGNHLFDVWQYTNGFMTTDEGTILGGYRAVMNDVPVLATVDQFMTAGMRNYCSAPNGDFIAWFPDYFGHYKQAGKMIITPLEIQQDSGPPTIGWSDTNLKTHQFVSGATVVGSGDANSVVQKDGTAGIASVEFPELMMALFHISKAEADLMKNDYLSRFGARPNFEAMDQISGARQEFFFACQKFQQNFAEQYQASVNLTFMPELYPGMLACFPSYGIQGYLTQTVDSFDYRDGGGFTTRISASPWSTIGNSKAQAANSVILPKGAAL